jgi:glycosyltransferase involved in cell wall biosynthesis
MVLVPELSIVLPAKNEAGGLSLVLPQIIKLYPDAEVIVVNDGSTDNTAEVAAECGARVYSHPYPMGNGAAIKSGARQATGNIIVFMDGDGQHRPSDIERLLEDLENGHDMSVGARNFGSQANLGRGLANTFYNWFASKIVSQKIDDLTSGFRAVYRKKFLSFLYLLPNGFSYPTTITMAFFRTGWAVSYVPIKADKREGDSHLRPIKDGIRFLLIIFKVATLYSPLKLFFPISAAIFFSSIGYYFYTYSSEGRLTNMVVILFMLSIIVFMIGLVSEQITMLFYKDNQSGE